MNHDQLFKQLLTNFFYEFIELFLPEVAAFTDRGSIEFLDKEVFTDLTAGERHEVDLVVKTRFRDQPTFFLVHVENQSTPQPAFARRMFSYFARLHEKHGLPVYPIALLSYDAPKRPEPDTYVVEFPNRRILEFHFDVIQLNRLNWRDFVRSGNPVASALMAKMDITPPDRPRVKLECLRLLATLKLNPAKMHLLAGFVDSYLRLNREEKRSFDQEVEVLTPDQKETVMQFTTSWHEDGIVEGLHRGKRDMAIKLLRRRFAPVPAEVESRLDLISDDALDDFAQALLDFTSLADATAWLDAHPNDPADPS